MSSPDNAMLFIACKGPWSSAAQSAGIDAMLTAAAFDVPVSVVFCSDGVYQLLSQQDGSKIGQKTLSDAFPAFELYDIHNLYAEEQALRARGIARTDLLMDVEVIEAWQLRALIAGSHTVFVL